MKRPITGFESSAFLNTQTFNLWYLRLKEFCINRFEWLNLPETIDHRYIENKLFEQGHVVWFKDEFNEYYLALQAALSGEPDIYDIPTLREIYTANGYTRTRYIDDSVIIYNNYMRTPDVALCKMYAYRIADIERTIDVNVRAQKTPLFISTTETQRLTMSNLFKKYDGNEVLIMGDKRLDPNAIQVINTGAPYVADKLSILKHEYINEFLSCFGFENSNQDKKERLVANEVASNYGVIEASRNIGLNARKEACKQINQMFGLNIDVQFRSNLQTLVNVAFKPELGREAIKEGQSDRMKEDV